MEQVYGKIFSKVYDKTMDGFARRVAPKIRNFYESTEVGKTDKNVLDVCLCTSHPI